MSEQRGDDLIGTKLGQYEIIEEIGRGGMATVYRGRQISINRTVAVKVLPRHFLHDPGFYERFEREVDVIAHLEHPHILPIYDFGKDRDVPYIVMRFLGGGSLAQTIRRGVPKLADLEKAFSQIGQALDHAHLQGIIHRDLKPGNVMLDENGNAYLSDFGIARIMGSNLTGSAIIGTPAYMSPEQAHGMPLDARSDIYSLGVVLFECITGREPFQAETPMALLLKHINEPIPPLRSFRDDIPDSVEMVIMRATAKNPNDRYSSAGEMAAAYSAALRESGPVSKSTPRLLYEDTPTITPDSGARFTPPPRPATGGYGTPAPITPPAYAAPPATGAQLYGQTEQIQKRSRLPLILGAVILGAVVIIGGALALPGLNPGEAPVTLIPATLAAPTPFADARRIEVSEYTISMPRAWIPPQGFIDISDSARLVHLWQDSTLEFYVAVEIPNNVSIRDAAGFETAVAAYEEQYYDPRADHLTLIDSGTAPDGTIRYSYRMVNFPDPPHPPGQLDVFYLNRAPYLVVVNMYSADARGNTLVSTFQDILDSLQVTTPT